VPSTVEDLTTRLSAKQSVQELLSFQDFAAGAGWSTSERNWQPEDASKTFLLNGVNKQSCKA
jgi:hypothetical protein